MRDHEDVVAMPPSSKSAGWINWASSESKLIIVKDLHRGRESFSGREQGVCRDGMDETLS